MSEWTHKNGVDGIRRQAQELIEQAHQRGYKEGYSKAETDYHEQTEKDRQSSYELGLNMAWEAAKKISTTESYKLYDIFEEGWFFNILNKFSASEAIDKLRAYEEQKKQEEDERIEVGDEVILHDGDKAVVTEHHSDRVCVVRYDGCTSFKFKDDMKKTGRHFSEIAEVLKKMQEGE